MYPRVPHIVRKSTFVCLLIALLIAAFFAGRASAKTVSTAPRSARILKTTMESRVLDKQSATPAVVDGMLAYAPRKNVQNATTVVYLHGIHGLAKNGCPWLRDGATEVGWLVCPDANVHLSNDTFSWGGSTSDKRAVVARAESAVHTNGPSVLVGFSQGAFVAVELIEARQGSYRGLVLLSATVDPRARDLAAAGVKRVVLGAGELDGSYAAMKSTADRLSREGVEVRFVSLGKVGHTYVAEDGAPLTAGIAWASTS
jgi:pimeloyl-ACP methyl ester carboxylesterase